MLETSDARARESNTESDGRVVELVGNDETSSVDQSRDGGRVGSESHGHDHGILGSQEARDKLLRLKMQIQRPSFQPGSTSTDPVLLDRRLYRIGTPSRSLSEPEIVVRRDVERTGLSTGKVEGSLLVGSLTVIAYDRSTGNTGSGTREAVVETEFQSTGVEGVEVGHQGGVALQKPSSALAFPGLLCLIGSSHFWAADAHTSTC